MTSDAYSISLVRRFAVSDKQRIPQGYFRSKIFVAAYSCNPLLAAAGPIFSLLERLSISASLPPIESIRDNIEHELHAFHSRLMGQEYSDELIAIAHFLLSSTIDELIGKNYLRIQGQVAEFKAFSPSSLDEAGPEKRFFDIVKFIRERSNQYLDLIELAYYCLILGFEGEYHVRSDGRQALDNLIEDLYQCIQEHRVHKPQRLFKEQKSSAAIPRNYKPLITAGLIAAVLISLSFVFSHILLEHKAKTVLLGHKLLANLEH